MSYPQPQQRQFHDPRLEAAIRDKVLSRDSRFELGAYVFLYDALAFTQHTLGRDDPDMTAEQRHVTGQELVDGIRILASDQFGPLAPAVFRSWGVQSTLDFGHVVFNLVESDLLGKTDSDRVEDFADRFDFDTAFDAPSKVRLS